MVCGLQHSRFSQSLKNHNFRVWILYGSTYLEKCESASYFMNIPMLMVLPNVTSQDKSYTSLRDYYKHEYSGQKKE